MTYSPNEYSQYRIERATQTLHEVEKHIDNQFWNTAINRMYYACFYAVSALLVKHGVESSSHSGIRQQFGQLFVKTGKFDKELAKHYADLFEKRQKGDYNDFFDYDQETATRLLPLSQKFVAEIIELLNK